MAKNTHRKEMIKKPNKKGCFFISKITI